MHINSARVMESLGAAGTKLKRKYYIYYQISCTDLNTYITKVAAHSAKLSWPTLTKHFSFASEKLKFSENTKLSLMFNVHTISSYGIAVLKKPFKSVLTES